MENIAENDVHISCFTLHLIFCCHQLFPSQLCR